MLLQIFNGSVDESPLCYQGSAARGGRILLKPNGFLFLCIHVEATGEAPALIDLIHDDIEIRLGGGLQVPSS